MSHAFRSHVFDERSDTIPQRKNPYISGMDEPPKGATGYTYFHKLREQEILPHRRENTRDCDVMFDGMFENDCDEEMNEEYGD